MRWFAFLLALTSFGQTADQAPFQDFLRWYKTYDGPTFPPEVRKAYIAELERRGMAKPAIDAHIGTVEKVAATTPPEFVTLNFNKIYQSQKAPFRAEPSRYLARIIEGRKPGKALDVGMGQGRNSVFLAGKGWDVTGYDLSDEGLAAARASAENAGLKIRTVLDSHEKFDYGSGQWDLIIQVFAWTNLSDEAYRKRVIDSLKPGGILLIEGFGDPSGKSKNTLVEAFRNLRILNYDDCTEVADWGLRPMRIERITVQKD